MTLLIRSKSSRHSYYFWRGHW